MPGLFTRLIFITIIISQNLFAQLLPQANLDSLKKNIHYLGNDELQGRATGSPGLEKASEFIAAYFASRGLKTAGDNNSYFQKIPMHGSQPLNESTLEIDYGNEKIYLKIGTDFLLIKTGAQTFIPKPVPLIFVGYGIIAPEFDYNDYNELDVAGKMVILLDGEPFVENDPEFFMGEASTLYSLPESKIRTAVSQGAVGSIIIQGADPDRQWSWSKKQIEYSFEDVSLPGQVTSHLGVFINPGKTDLLFKKAAMSYEQILQKNHAMESQQMNISIGFNGLFKQREFKSANVLAMQPGLDKQLADQYLIIGAHYDHLGIGPAINDDDIYNGVLDNAVGTAIVMELARMFSQKKPGSKRSVLFVLFTGEEKGLLGSNYYIDHPAAALYKTIAMVNIDGLSAMGEFASLIPVGGDYSTLGDVLDDMAAEYGFKIEKIPQNLVAEESFRRSDQISFAQNGIPSILIIEGFDYKNLSREEALRKNSAWFNEKYHTPFDDLHQEIDYEAVQRYTQFIFAFCNRLLNMSDTPQWNSGAPFKYKRLQHRAEKR